MSSLTDRLQQTAVPAVAAFWRWWTGELRDIGQSIIKIESQPRARANIYLRRNSVVIERFTGGVGERFIDNQPLDQLDEADWDDLKRLVGDMRRCVILERPDIHSTVLTLPKAARGRIRNAVALQLHEILPLDPALIGWTLHTPQIEEDSLTVRVTMAQTRCIEAISSLFGEHDLPAPSVWAHVDGDLVELARGEPEPARVGGNILSKPILVAAALLLSVPASTLLSAEILIRRNESDITELTQAIGPVVEAERRARATEQLRQALSQLSIYDSASTVVEDLAKRIPTTAYAESIQHPAGGPLKFVVDAQDPDQVRPALAHDPLLPGIVENNQTRTADAHIQVTYEVPGA